MHVCCAPKVANAQRGGGLAGAGDGEEEADEEGQAAVAGTTTAAAWRMLSGYERSREAAVMVDALARVVAGGAPPAGARQVVSPAGAWPGYDYDALSPSYSAQAHGNHIS